MLREPCPDCHSIGWVADKTPGPGLKWQPCKTCKSSGFVEPAPPPPQESAREG